MPRFLLLVLLVSAAACVRVDRTTTTPLGTILPEQLLGEWQGTWNAPGSHNLPIGQRQIRLTVQAFGTLPVLRLQSNNPCLQPEVYRLQLTQRSLSLIGQESRFLGEFTADLRALNGTFQCSGIQGDWQVAWVRDIDPIGDLTGLWAGSFAAPLPGVTGALTLELRQNWIDGFLELQGGLSLAASGAPLAVQRGEVVWDDGDFEMYLVTEPVQDVTLMLFGHGSGPRLVVDEGFFVVRQSDGSIVAAGTWRATWLGH